LNGITFANPYFLYLLVVIPLLTAWYIWKRKQSHPTMEVSSIQPFAAIKPTLRIRMRHVMFALRMLALGLIIVALARPQSHSSQRNVSTEGVDIVVALDISSSMEAMDFKPSRIEAAKKTAMEFIENRINDRIGLVIFAAESFTQCPITSDHSVLKNLFESIHTEMLQDGTAIGLGLATSISRLKDSKAKSKVIILITDGVNNTGYISPVTASDLAKMFGIRVYTIGVGTRGRAMIPVKTPYGIQNMEMEVQIDEDLLQKIAQNTNGKYFRATGNESLKKVYEEIDKLEKTRFEESIYNRYSEEFLPFALVAALLLLIEILLRFTMFRNLP
jgi:Ca-activated chloride channel family protein